MENFLRASWLSAAWERYCCSGTAPLGCYRVLGIWLSALGWWVGYVGLSFTTYAVLVYVGYFRRAQIILVPGGYRLRWRWRLLVAIGPAVHYGGHYYAGALDIWHASQDRLPLHTMHKVTYGPTP